MAYIDNVTNILQIQPDGLPTFVRLSQNENGRNLYFQLVGNEIDIPANSTVVIEGTKPDGTVYSGTGSISDNVILIPEMIQMTAVAGFWDAKVKIISGGNTVATGRIRFVIDADTVEPGSVPSDSVLEGLVAEAQQYAETARTEAYGSPLTATTAAGMTDKTRVYVYTGSESGYTAGHWYYWNGSAWADGGVYNSTAVNTDTTLTLRGEPADAYVTGLRIKGVQADIDEISHNTANLANAYRMAGNGVTVDDGVLSGSASAFASEFALSNGGMFPWISSADYGSDRYTLSFRAKNDTHAATTTGLEAVIFYTDASSDALSLPNNTADWTDFSITSAAGKSIAAFLMRAVSEAGYVWHIDQIQLVKGTTVTEYTPSRVLDTDPTLTISGKAADAKVTGDEITQLKGDLNDSVNGLRHDLYGGEYEPQSWQDGMIYNHLESSNSTFQRTGEITLNKGETITFTGGKGTTAVPVNAITRVVDGAYQALKYYSGQTAEVITYTATVDMIVIVSTLKTLYGNDLEVEKIGTLENIQNEIDEIPEYVKNDITATRFTLASSGSVQYPITKGNTYIIKNNGTNTISLSTRTSPSAVTVDNVVVAGGISKQFEATGNAAYIVCSTACDFEISTTKTLVPFIDSTLYKLGNYGISLPLVRFDFNRTFGDYADELSGVDFMANNGKWYSIMQTVYDKFDSLASEYPNYITRVDAGEDVGLTYPAYANLNGEASRNYSPTPTYRTYMYKLVDTNSFIYSSRNPRKKLFLIGSTHGNETAGAFNLYLFAKNLCEATNSDYFKLRESFDVYIVPCLNGYGMCHYVRWNADGVDINRNYPISNWAESGEPFVIGYTGPSPASEFETQLIVALQNKYSFDVAVDHHNYGASSSQFYTEFWYERFNAFANAALADCSSMFIENLPVYFGTNYRLFVDITNSTRPNVVLSDTMPCMAKWMYEQGLDFAATIEIGNQINYINGELNTAADIPKYTDDVFKVGEFTLRNQLLYYCGFVLGGVV